MLRITLDLSPLGHALRELDQNLDTAMAEALQQAGEFVAQEARTNHGYTDRTGDLTRSIGVEVAGEFFGGDLVAEVSAVTPYAKFIEEGTRAHPIAARTKALRFRGRDGHYVFRRRVQHPGTKAYWFLAGALERVFPAVQERTSEGLRAGFKRSGFEVA
jgi:hypothetical protein